MPKMTSYPLKAITGELDPSEMRRSYMFDDKTAENRRKMREDKQVELRRQKREELLNKRRSFSFGTPSTAVSGNPRDKLNSDELEDVYQMVYDQRCLLSVENTPPIQSVIDSGLVPLFVSLLDVEFLTSSTFKLNGQPVDAFKSSPENTALLKEKVDKIRIEAAWVLTNIASGTTSQTAEVVQAGAIPLLVKMLAEDNENAVDQAVWALGNISGDSEAMRDVVLGTGALSIILNLLSEYYDSSRHIKMLRNLTWLLSNLNRGRNPPPTFENMKMSLESLLKLIMLNDVEVCCDSFWALSYIVDVDAGCTNLILGSDVMGRSYNLLQALTNKLNQESYNTDDYKLANAAISPIIRMLGNIVTGSDSQTDALVRMGFLRFFETIFYKLEGNKQSRIRKEICWTISNITAGTADQVQTVVNENLVPLLIDAISSYELFIRKEACWALSNILFHCNRNFEWLELMLEARLIESLQDYLEAVPNLPEMQCQILDCFRYTLEGGKNWATKIGTNPVFHRMIELDLCDTIESLQDSYDPSVSDKAYRIVVDFFNGQEN